MTARTSNVRRTLILALAVGMLLGMMSPAQAALNVLSKARIVSLQVFDDGRARFSFEYTCPDYDYQVLEAWAAVSQFPGVQPSANITFNDEVVCDGTAQRLVKTLRSTSSEPNPALRTSSGVRLSIRSDSDPWPGTLDSMATARFASGGAREHFDIRVRRVWVNDLDNVKTRFTYTCPTGAGFDEEDADNVEIRWSQTTSEGQPGGGAGQSETLWNVLVCDDTMHTVVMSDNDRLFSPSFLYKCSSISGSLGGSRFSQRRSAFMTPRLGDILRA